MRWSQLGCDFDFSAHFTLSCQTGFCSDDISFTTAQEKTERLGNEPPAAPPASRRWWHHRLCGRRLSERICKRCNWPQCNHSSNQLLLRDLLWPLQMCVYSDTPNKVSRIWKVINKNMKICLYLFFVEILIIISQERTATGKAINQYAITTGEMSFNQRE